MRMEDPSSTDEQRMRNEDALLPSSSKQNDDCATSNVDSVSSPSELAFLVSHWLQHYETNNNNNNNDMAQQRIRQLGQELSESFSNIGAFGKTFQNPIASEEERYRNATYTDVALRWPSLPPNRLQHVLTAAHQTTLAATHEASQLEQQGRWNNKPSLLKLQQQQQQQEETTEKDATTASRVPSAMQPPALFSSSYQVSSRNNNNNSNSNNNNINTNLSLHNRGGRTLNGSNHRFVLGATNTEQQYSDNRLADAGTTQYYLPLPLLSDPTLLGKQASDASRTYLQLQQEYLSNHLLLRKLKRDLERKTQQEHSSPSFETERIVGHLTRSIAELSPKLQASQQQFNDAKHKAMLFYNLHKDICRNYQNPFLTTSSTTTKNVLTMLTRRSSCTATTSTTSIATKNTRKHILATRTSHILTINAHLFYPVYCLRMDRTGMYFVSGADDHLAKLFRLGDLSSSNNNTGATLVCTLKGHAGVVTDIDVSVDNALLATAGEDGDCRIWGLRDGSPIAVLRGHVGGVTMVSFSLTTPYVLTTTAEDGFARVWDVREASLKRYVGIVGNRKEYANNKSNNNAYNNSRYALHSNINDTNATTTIRRELTEELFSASSTHQEELVDTAAPPLPPIPLRQINHDDDIHAPILPPIPIAQQQPPPQPPIAAGDFEPAVALNGNEESILDEGVKLLTKLNHGASPEDEGGVPVVETRSQRRKLKVVCLSRNPIGGQFATGSEDGVGRIWSDVDDVYSDGMMQQCREKNCTTSKNTLVHFSEGLSSSAGAAMSSPGGNIDNLLQPCYLLATLSGHLNAITDLHYSHRGDRILTASQNDGVVRIWSWDNSSEFEVVVHSHFHAFTTRTTTTTTRAKGLQNVRQVMIRLVPLFDAKAGTGTNSTANKTSRSRRTAASRASNSDSNVCSTSVQCDVAVWTAHDLYIVTSQSIPAKQSLSSHSRSAAANSGLGILPLSQVLQVWDSRDGQCLLSIQGAHSAPCNIVLPHPLDPSILLSAGSDGVALIWDIASGSKVFSYENRLTHGAMAEAEHNSKLCAFLDGSWNETSGVILLTDDYGRILLFGIADYARPLSVPTVPGWMNEQYFASDYYEMVYDSHGYALDSRSNLPPHLAPRAVRCTHTGTSIGDTINRALLQLKGPWPICEKQCVEEKRGLMHRAFAVRCHLARDSSRQLRSNNGTSTVILGKPHGGVLIYGPIAQDVEALSSNGFGGVNNSAANNISRGTTGSNSGRSTRAIGNRPARSLSSRYHYLEYEDIVSSDEEDNNDEEFLPGQRDDRRLGRGAVASESVAIAESVTGSSSGSGGLDDSTSDDESNNSNSNSNSPRRLRSGRRSEGSGRTLRGQGRSSSGHRSSRQANRRRVNHARERATRGSRAHVDNDASTSVRRISSRAAHRNNRYKESHEDETSDIEELLSPNSPPKSKDAYNGHYYDDLQAGHMWKLPRGKKDVYRDWLRRDESRSGYTGKKSYAPQVGDSVVYIPRAHYDTLLKHPALMMETAPWKKFPPNSTWPVVLCRVVNVRYRFPHEALLKDERSVVAIVEVEVTGIPKMRSQRDFQWPMPEFIHQRTNRCFELSLFQCDTVEYLIPEALYLWRQISLEAAIQKNCGNPKGIELFLFNAAGNGADGSDDFAEDAALVQHPAKILSVAGLIVYCDKNGIPHVDFESSGFAETERHFKQCGYDCVRLKWEDDTEGHACLWELNVKKMPIEDIPLPPGISESAQIRLLETLTAVVNEEGDSRIKDFFFLPVDTRRYSDYELMIEVPMDLSLVKRRLQHSYYTNLDSFLNDIKLIKLNCNKYNDESADICEVADKLYRCFEDQVREIEASQPAVDPDPEKIQKLLLEKVNALNLPTLESRRRSRHEERNDVRNPAEDMTMPTRSRTRGRISGDLDHLATLGASDIASRTRHSLRAIRESTNIDDERTQSELVRRSKRTTSEDTDKKVRQCRSSNKRPRSSYVSEKQQQSKRPRRASRLSYQEPASEDEETERYISESNRVNLYHEDNNHSSRSTLTRGMNRREVVNAAISVSQNGDRTKTRPSIRQVGVIDQSRTQRLAERSSKQKASLSKNSHSPSLRNREPKSYYVPSSNDECIQESDESYVSQNDDNQYSSSASSDEDIKTNIRLRSKGTVGATAKAKINLKRSTSVPDDFSVTSESSKSESTMDPKETKRGNNRGKMANSSRSPGIRQGKRRILPRKANAATTEFFDDSDSFHSGSSVEVDKAPQRIKKKPAAKKKRPKKAGKQKGNRSIDLIFSDIQPWREVSSRKIRAVATAIVQKLMELDVDSIFLKPVVDAFPQIADAYLNAITKPIDLTTIINNVRAYLSIHELQQDLILMFKNCCDYNGYDSDLGRYSKCLCEQLPAIFNDVYQNIKTLD